MNDAIKSVLIGRSDQADLRIRLRRTPAAIPPVTPARDHERGQRVYRGCDGTAYITQICDNPGCPIPEAAHWHTVSEAAP